MNSEQLANYFITSSIPYQVTLELTLSCNLRCKHCYQRGIKAKPLKTEGFISIIRELKDIGVLFLHLNGGEAALSPSFWSVAEFASDLGLLLTIFTNGTQLNNPFVKRLAKLNIHEIRVSLYGKEDFHDSFVGKSGAHAATTEALHHLKNYSLRGIICTCLMNSNSQELPYLSNLASIMNMSLSIDTQIFPAIKGRSDNSRLQLDDLKIESLLTTSNDYDSRSRPQPTLLEKLHDSLRYRGVCLAGNVTCAIGPDGSVFPCSMLRVPTGNLLNMSFSNIWNNSDLFNWFRTVNLKKARQTAGPSKDRRCCRMQNIIPRDLENLVIK